MKKIAIVGAGEIGAFIAERLNAEKFDVTVIDRNPEVLSNLQNTLDVAGVQGNATNIKDLINADIQDADLFIATTRQDETNLVSCLLSRELKIPHNIAVTRYLGSRDKVFNVDNAPLGIDMVVNTSEVVKDEIMDVVETTGPSEVATFAEGQIILIGYQISADSHLIDKKISDVAGKGTDLKFFVGSMVRNNKLMTPTADTVLERDDYLYLITIEKHMQELNAVLHVETIKSRTAIVYGDNYLSQLLAGALLNRHFHVTMLAATEGKADFLKQYFANRRHFHVEVGEGTEARLLRRVKAPATSLFVATTSDDASNLTGCLVAKNLGVGKTVASIKRNDIMLLCPQAGVDANIAPRLATAKVIQKVVHENRVLDYRAVSRTNLEVIELEVKGKCGCTKAPIGKLKLPEGVIIGGIVSDGVPSLPNSGYTLKAGDKAIVLTLPEHIVKVESLFGD
ncbi:MAG: Trk system potassium transporter TrkA [SAR324 cluster bacterium]|nr:Trk system potassium transporter TrkA [SAR324 cluster bacterium]